MNAMYMPTRLGTAALLVLAVSCARDTSVDVEKVPVGSEVAVTRQDGGVVQGTLTERDPVAVKVDIGRSVRSVPREQIADVQLVKAEVPVVLPPVAKFHEYTLAAGTEMSVRLDTDVSSATSAVEDPITGTLTESVVVDDVTLLPAGSTLKGEVSSAEPAGKVKGRATLGLRFRTITVDGHEAPYAILLAINRVAPATKGEDAKKIGIPAAGGAILGGILGGKKGAVIGGTIGGGAGTAVVLSTAGKEVHMPAGTVLTLSLNQPVEIRVPLKK
jgi:hypothetical protein